MRRQLFNDLKECLEQIKLSNNEQAIKHVTLWNNQTKYLQQEVFPTPAVFIQFMPIKWMSQSRNIQDAEVSVKFHIVIGSLSTGAEPAGEDCLNALDLCDTIHTSIANIAVHNISRPTRTDSDTDHDHGVFSDYTETYKMLVTDISAMPKTIKMKRPDAEITASVE